MYKFDDWGEDRELTKFEQRWGNVAGAALLVLCVIVVGLFLVGAIPTEGDRTNGSVASGMTADEQHEIMQAEHLKYCNEDELLMEVVTTMDRSGKFKVGDRWCVHSGE